MAALNTCERFKALPVLQQWRRWEAMKYYSVANPAQLPEPNLTRMPPSCAAFVTLPSQDQANRLIEALSKERPGHYSFSVAENGIEDLASREHYNANNLLCQYLNGEINRAQFDERVLVAIGEDTRNNPMAEGEVQDVFFPSTATINSIGTDPSSEVERICAFGMGELSRSDFDKQMATLKAQRLIQVVSEPKAQPPAATQAIENPSRIAPSHHHRRRRSATSAAKS